VARASAALVAAHRRSVLRARRTNSWLVVPSSRRRRVAGPSAAAAAASAIACSPRVAASIGSRRCSAKAGRARRSPGRCTWPGDDHALAFASCEARARVRRRARPSRGPHRAPARRDLRAPSESAEKPVIFNALEVGSRYWASAVVGRPPAELAQRVHLAAATADAGAGAGDGAERPSWTRRTHSSCHIVGFGDGDVRASDQAVPSEIRRRVRLLWEARNMSLGTRRPTVTRRELSVTSGILVASSCKRHGTPACSRWPCRPRSARWTRAHGERVTAARAGELQGLAARRWLLRL
jgi:hypothetical protein